MHHSTLRLLKVNGLKIHQGRARPLIAVLKTLIDSMFAKFSERLFQR